MFPWLTNVVLPLGIYVVWIGAFVAGILNLIRSCYYCTMTVSSIEGQPWLILKCGFAYVGETSIRHPFFVLCWGWLLQCRIKHVFLMYPNHNYYWCVFWVSSSCHLVKLSLQQGDEDFLNYRHCTHYPIFDKSLLGLVAWSDEHQILLKLWGFSLFIKHWKKATCVTRPLSSILVCVLQSTIEKLKVAL